MSQTTNVAAEGDPVGPVPPWMDDSRYVSPLVVAYDVQMNRLNKEMVQITGIVEATKKEVLYADHKQLLMQQFQLPARNLPCIVSSP